MLPVLLDLKFIKIYTFGIFLVLAFFWGAYLLWKNIRLTSFKEEDMFDGLFLAVTGGIVGARLTYVVFHLNNFGLDILKIVLINGYPGLSLFGGLIGALVTLFSYVLIKKIDIKQVIDYFMSPFLLVLGIGKLGSLFAGVDVGTKTRFFLSIHYVGYDGLRHIPALYESILYFIGAYFANRFLFQMRRGTYRPGFVFMASVGYFSLVTFVFDKLKVDHLYLLGASLNVLLSGSFGIVVFVYLVYYFRSDLKAFIGTISRSLFGYGTKTFSGFSQKGRKKSKGSTD